MSIDEHELFGAPAATRSGTHVWLRQHASAARNGIADLVARPVDTALTALVLGVAIALPVSLMVVLHTLEQAAQTWADRHELTVFLDEHAEAQRAADLAANWRNLPGVTGTRIVTPDQAMVDLQELLGITDLNDTVGTSLLPFLVIVELDRRSANPRVLSDRLAAVSDVNQVQFDQEWITKVDAIVRIGSRIAAVLIVLLGIGALVVIGNTIRLGVERRREESDVLAMLGASAAFVRRPFLYHGFGHGLLGGLIGYLLVAVLVLWLKEPFDDLAHVWSAKTTLSIPAPWVGALIVLAAAIFGTLAARASARPELLPRS